MNNGQWTACDFLEGSHFIGAMVLVPLSLGLTIGLLPRIDELLTAETYIGARNVEQFEFEPSFSGAFDAPDGSAQHLHRPERFYVLVRDNQKLVRAKVSPEVWRRLEEGSEVELYEKRSLFFSNRYSAIVHDVDCRVTDPHQEVHSQTLLNAYVTEGLVFA